MAGKLLSDSAARRTAEVVRTVERWPRDERRGSADVRHPSQIEICRFEMSDALNLPQHGPGVATALMLRWDDERDHTWAPESGDLAYDDFLGQSSHNWKGDVSDDMNTRYEDSTPRYERIVLLDTMRAHSKMATSGGDVGAYGLAWRAADSIVKLVDVRPPVSDPWSGSIQDGLFDHIALKWPLPVWEILTMQTPGPFWGRMSALSHASASTTVTVFRPSGEGHYTLWGFDPFGPAYGKSQTVYNIPSTNQYGGAYAFAGNEDDICLCVWNMRLARYEFAWIEPNNAGWTTQSVVTSVNFTAETVENVSIQIPPWAPVI